MSGMYTFNRIGIGFCVLRMFKFFPGGHETEVRDDSCVVVVGKRETATYLKRWQRRWRKPVLCQCG